MIFLEEPLLQAEIMISSSRTLSLILPAEAQSRSPRHDIARVRQRTYSLLPLCTMKISWSRTDVSAKHISSVLWLCSHWAVPY